MHSHEPAYGLWSLVIVNSAIFIFFAFSFTRPRTKREWRSLGAFSAFIVALFTEMYGVPITIYFLSGWLARRFPGVDFLSHDQGHLLYTLLGGKGNPHASWLHWTSDLLIFSGFLLVAAAWKVLHEAQSTGSLATGGPYAWVRHPQYVGFIAVMLGFLIQWPTLLTLAMFPVLVWMYLRLARREEAEVAAAFGQAWTQYRARTGAFLPRLRHRPPGPMDQSPRGAAHPAR